MTKQFEKNQLKQAEMQGNEAQITQEETGSRKMITQLNKKQLKQFKNQSQTGYMQSNEPQIISGEARKKEIPIRQDRIIENQSQSGEMMIKNTQNKKESSKHKSMLSIYKKNIIETHSQSGRSMVEMLGVLAIIAILSIGGIVGFRLAMNYYQANQIAHEMNIMRTDAQIKIAQGTEELMLGDPYDSGNIQFNGYKTDFDCLDMETETSTPNKVVFCAVANAYYIELQEIPEGVCKPLANLIDNMDNEIAFYINDKSVDETEGEKGACNEEFNTLKVIFGADSDSEAIKCDGEGDSNCPAELPVCLNHVCVECETYHDCQGEKPQCDEISHTCKSCAEINPNKPLWDNNECKECPANQLWNGRTCGCGEFKQCETGYFCLSNCSSCESGDQEPADCTFICEKIEEPEKKKIGDITYYHGEIFVNWWSADRYCKALKAQGTATYGTLIGLDELGCENGKTGNGACINGELRQKLNSSDNGVGFSSFVWTDDYNNCVSYLVDLRNGKVVPFVLNNDNRGDDYPLCK